MSMILRTLAPAAPLLKPLGFVLVWFLLLLAAACSSSGSAATEWTFGDSLAVRAKQTKFVQEVRYSICYPIGDPKCTPKHYLIKPSQQDRVILAAQLEVFNRQANVVFLSVHKHAVSLVDQNFFEYQPLDPFTDRTDVDSAGPAENTLLPLLWADGSELAPEITMPAKCGQNNENCQLVGWLFFEVPKTVKPTQIVWQAADTIYMDFGKG